MTNYTEPHTKKTKFDILKHHYKHWPLIAELMGSINECPIWQIISYYNKVLLHITVGTPDKIDEYLN